MDKKIGELMDLLEAEGWLENSIIVVASDNGGCPSGGGCNYPLRGTKGSMFEAGTKVKTLNCLFFDEEYLIKNFITCFPSAVTIFFFGGDGSVQRRNFSSASTSTTTAVCMHVVCALRALVICRQSRVCVTPNLE